MNTVLSVQGASAPVEKKSFFSKFTAGSDLLCHPARTVSGSKTLPEISDTTEGRSGVYSA